MKFKEWLIYKLLKTYPSGYYPTPIFEELCRLMTVVAIELIPITQEKDDTKVIMLQRPKNDIHWPLQWHTAGCIVRPGDTIEQALNRVIFEEMGLPSNTKSKFLGIKQLRTVRGNGIGICYMVRVKTRYNGKAFSVSKLPRKMINYQRDLIYDAVSTL